MKYIKSCYLRGGENSILIKIISSVLIIICCSLLGIHMSYRYTQRINNIRELRNVLSHLETEIVNYSTLLVHAIGIQ